MKISYKWLQDYVDLGADMTPEKLAELLTDHGIPVEVIERLNKGVHNVVVGHVVQTEQHPNADKLKVCRVDAGQAELLQIVCGAPNVKAGQKVPCALPGAELPGDIKIKRAKLRGVESQGMLCSAAELGLDTRLLPKEQTEGLYILPEDAKPGELIEPLLGLDDVVLELELTPNRADCLSYRGVAYEVAAILNRKVKFEGPVSIPVTEPANSSEQVKVEIQSDNCTQYSVQVVKGIQVAPSPLWLQTRLLTAGIRPISNIVDVTNYVMLEYGQPLHAFDLSQVKESTIIVRQAKAGERIVTLDGQERQLDESMLVIADPERAIGLAGVMGGENSEVREQTSMIALESAYFDPGTTRLTGKKLGLRSEAQMRFEKGIDPSIMRSALLRAAQLMADLGGGQVVGQPVEIISRPAQELTIDLRITRTNQILGTNLSAEVIQSFMQRLGFAVSERDADTLAVTVPVRRTDISREIDLIEEAARLYGYDKISTTMPVGVLSQGAYTGGQWLRRTIRELLSGMGLLEIVTYSFTSPGSLQPLSLADESPLRKQIPLALPMSDERKVLRTTMLPSLAEVVGYNLNRKNNDLALFEIGTVFHPNSLPITEQPLEKTKLAAILTGGFGSQNIGEKPRKVDFYTVKGIVETLLSQLGITNVVYNSDERPGMHPGRTARAVVNGTEIGFFGALHPLAENTWGLKETYYLELDVNTLQQFSRSAIEFRPLPKFPAIERDLAVVVTLDIPAGSLEQTIREAAGDLLKEVRLFDVYQGEQVAAGNKSVAFSLVYRAEDRTLTDEEVQVRHDQVVQSLREKYQAELRA
ncbi:phenylalanine--tRNA ligase subunit beta [Effusibacillus dendaii]|uniref:Phenylalanine--tRNA ligase beta subunit n=1 Tax=Effusibacillus dendaii TaxID=2743772 RepID=A0A7I8DDC3_9BACL|nr:phenylalanine--tRNA ligase subunit beta [Effusibacillus dendaii]BCJ88095.1 phenylalanine--tRNA ligase beta subunit [Effusibacillus dendaii]